MFFWWYCTIKLSKPTSIFHHIPLKFNLPSTCNLPKTNDERVGKLGMLSGTEVDRLDGYCGTTADQSSLGCCGWWQDIPMTNELEIVTVRGHRKRSRHDWWPSPHMSLGVFSLFEPDLLYLTVLKHQHISRVDTFMGLGGRMKSQRENESKSFSDL